MPALQARIAKHNVDYSLLAAPHTSTPAVQLLCHIFGMHQTLLNGVVGACEYQLSRLHLLRLLILIREALDCAEPPEGESGLRNLFVACIWENLHI